MHVDVYVDVDVVELGPDIAGWLVCVVVVAVGGIGRGIGAARRCDSGYVYIAR